MFIMEKSGRLSESDWQGLYSVVEFEGIDVVVLDHATTELDGDSNRREPLVDLWGRLDRFGPGLAPILVGHATDSKWEGKMIKRPMGNDAATQLPRARVHLFAPGEVRNPKRVLELDSNNVRKDPIQCRQGENGYIELDEEANEKQRQRSTQTTDQNKALVEAALSAPGGMTQVEACEWIAEQPGVNLSPGSARTQINRMKDMKWDKGKKKYMRIL